MKKYIKPLNFLLAIVMVISLIGMTGCSTTSNAGTGNSPASSASAAPASPSGTTAATPSPTPAAKPIKVGICLANADDFTANLKTVYQSMEGTYGIQATYTNAGGVDTTQVSDLESLIAQKPDVIVLRCINADIADTLVKMVHDAAIPCVVDETQPKTNKDYNVNVAGNQIIHGNLIGQYLQTYLDKNPDKKLYMLYINGGTSDNIRKRMTGIFQTCTSKNLIQVGDENGTFSATKAQEITEAYLTSHPEMNVIACANDEMALAVIQTLKSAGKLQNFMVFGVDGTASGQASIKAGELTATTLNDVTVSVKLIFQCCQKLAKGETLDSMYTNAATKVIDPKAYVLLTKDNIDSIVKK